MKAYIGPYGRELRWGYDLEDYFMKKKYGLSRYVELSDESYDKIDRAVIWVAEHIQLFLDAVYNRWIRNASRKVKVKIDGYDLWNADETLALIIHPILVELRQLKQGAPFVDNEDVPEELHYHGKPEDDETVFERWDYVLGEMTWAFAQLADHNSEDQFYTVNENYVEDTEADPLMVGGFDFDREGMKLHDKRIANGLRLFGKYYRGLWT